MTDLRTGYSLAVHCGREPDQAGQTTVFEQALRLREAVYCARLGWETPEAERTNPDDGSSVHLVVSYDRIPVGTMRIVLPSQNLPVWRDHDEKVSPVHPYTNSLEFPEVGRLAINAEAFARASNEHKLSEVFQGRHSCCRLMFSAVYRLCEEMGFPYAVVHTTELVIRLAKSFARHRVGGVNRNIITLEKPVVDHTGEPRGIYLVPTGLYRCEDPLYSDFVGQQLLEAHTKIEKSDLLACFRSAQQRRLTAAAQATCRPMPSQPIDLRGGPFRQSGGGADRVAAMRYDA